MCLDLCLAYQTCGECLMLWPQRVKAGHKFLYRSLSVSTAVVKQPVGYGGTAHHHPQRHSSGAEGQHWDEDSRGAVDHHMRGQSGRPTGNYVEGYPAAAMGHHMVGSPGGIVSQQARYS